MISAVSPASSVKLSAPTTAVVNPAVSSSLIVYVCTLFAPINACECEGLDTVKISVSSVSSSASFTMLSPGMFTVCGWVPAGIVTTKLVFVSVESSVGLAVPVTATVTVTSGPVILVTPEVVSCGRLPPVASESLALVLINSIVKASSSALTMFGSAIVVPAIDPYDVSVDVTLPVITVVVISPSRIVSSTPETVTFTPVFQLPAFSTTEFADKVISSLHADASSGIVTSAVGAVKSVTVKSPVIDPSSFENPLFTVTTTPGASLFWFCMTTSATSASTNASYSAAAVRASSTSNTTL